MMRPRASRSRSWMRLLCVAALLAAAQPGVVLWLVHEDAKTIDTAHPTSAETLGLVRHNTLIPHKDETTANSRTADPASALATQAALFETELWTQAIKITPVPSPPRAELLGTELTGTERVATVVLHASDALVAMKQGDVVDGWRIMQVRQQSLIVMQEEFEGELGFDGWKVLPSAKASQTRELPL